MKILIMGIDGYIGFPLAMRLLNRGHQVYGLDNYITRRRVSKVGSDSALPILSLHERNRRLKRHFGHQIPFFYGDASNPDFVYKVIEKIRPDAVVHLAEQRSAPYSMIGLREANETMVKNITSTMNLIYAIKDIVPEAHILKLGTMGEYGTPNIDIPEGFFEIEYNGRRDVLPFPKNAGSWYHWTKVHDSNNLMFANRVWNLAVTDVMQGVVYGTKTQEIDETGLYTRFDIDEVYGTALNRFTAEAIIDMPLTVYGKGGQTRGFLSLNDSIQCLTLALEKPPKAGEYRVLNQFDEKYSVGQLAEMVQRIFENEYGKRPEIAHLDNPRVEKEEHYYNPEHRKLEEMGYRRTKIIEEEIVDAISDLSKFRDRIYNLRGTLMPKTFWKLSAYN